MNKLIGLAGPAQSGKSTVATYLKNQHKFHEDSFAAPIREFVAHILSLSLKGLEFYKEKQIPSFTYTPREMMQTVGTEWGRQMIQDDLWLVSLLRRIENHKAQDIVISDVRFDNEAVVLRNLGGEIWYIARPDSSISSNHVSEAGINICTEDISINNDETLINLYLKVDKLLEY